jgi:YbbR domain-containing protein
MPKMFDNLGLKLFALVLGFSLWYVVAGEQRAEIVFSVPLELRNMPKGLEVLNQSAQEVDVRLRGSSEIVRGLTPGEIQVAVDLGEVGPGSTTYYLSPDVVDVPFGVRVMRIVPASLEIQLDQTEEKPVRVVPRVVGEPASGFTLAGIELSPASVTVSGPASRLKGLEQVTTEPLSAEGLREPHTRPAQILIEDPLVRISGLSKVIATLDVREEEIEVELAGVALVTRPETPEARLSPASVRVVVSGPRSLVGQLRAEDLEGVINLEGLGPGDYQLAPEVRPRNAEGSPLEVLSLKPAKVRVRLPGGGS